MRASGLALIALCSGCSLLTDSFVTNDFSGDLFPIDVDTSNGAVIVGLREAGQDDRIAVLDALSPITLVDRGPDVQAEITLRTLVLLGRRDTGSLDLPRAQFTDASVLTLHPCDDVECSVGTSGAERAYQAVIGADALAGDALRLRLGDQQIKILADIAGDASQRAEVCDAVYPSPYGGGGTLVVAGTELGFTGRRITMQTCLGANPDPALPQSQRGADALMLVSTSIGPSLLGESAYARFANLLTNPTPLDQLPIGEVFLPSGPISGHLTTVPNLALVARSSTSGTACRHVYAHHLLQDHDCLPGEDCPCSRDDDPNGNGFCAQPAIVELEAAAGLPVLVVADDEPTLQALRAELRPDQAEVDGILGTSALTALELDVDYPHDRVLARCTTAECTMRTALPEDTASDRAIVTNCADFKQ